MYLFIHAGYYIYTYPPAYLSIRAGYYISTCIPAYLSIRAGYYISMCAGVGYHLSMCVYLAIALLPAPLLAVAVSLLCCCSMFHVKHFHLFPAYLFIHAGYYYLCVCYYII